MRISPIAAVVAALVLSACAKSYDPPQQPAFMRSLVPAGSQVDADAAADMFSQYRMANGRGPLVVDPVLQTIALEQARAMASEQKVGHNVGIGTLDKRAARAGYDYDNIAENVAGGYHSLGEAFSGWRDSSGHRKNMLMPEATRMGIAVAQAPGSKYKVFWAMVVAKPHSPGR
ncbi:hypothetical protein GCM10007276_00470 [Agaricicola taiwanensis]|uniref:SCP domain-containing protein n=1 Tax=Agaricicola taiwanensis TaxID=591372 RepID=A0A8J2VEF5_9RHOB|nr:CAP domain-containing protein [Agaricicola taiwanensis]GGE27216.1 hypothetical protein GCM10007276_00470 [Agaricicola taiwanensis]